MEVWLIRDGEKIGPFHDYEIRRMIDVGELTADSPAWHEGQPAWLKISEIEIFKKEFEPKPVRPEPTETSFPGARRTPPPIPESPKIIRRFWARWLDLKLYDAALWLLLWAAGCDLGNIYNNLWYLIPWYAPWFVLETFLIQKFGTTPGKALLGLRVEDINGSKLSLPNSLNRAMRVYVVGIGFGYSVLMVLCQVLSLFTIQRLGSPIWDFLGGHRIKSKSVGPLRIAVVVLLFIVASQIQFAVYFPAIKDDLIKTFPFLENEIRTNPPWHLPPRNSGDH
ncbi:RDD family protein [Luteolibacter pohnpeiensis]|uniref:RDD family protein n=1 Tax=Luteolibacter pohnpeiensis TaxID=454153 RepID=A0A934VV79_9BACT|nr:RDD family protein [Luteolibacter pohnpeiensis]MBK1881513.1 RDD family protein [Luteolibacter pohnpeiensis]